ncbi:MAG TPA: type II secretion system F family protein [Candidatus Acidoferrales bacterium]|nr:type II secretion system F family protein [Candidatus Acidoferrales bacterium]
MALMIAIITFIVTSGIGALIWLSLGAESGQQVVRRRIEEVQSTERRSDTVLGLKLVRDDLMSGVPPLDRMMVQWTWARRFREFVSQAGMKTRPGKIFLTCGVLAALGFLLAGFFHARFPLPILVAAAAGVIPLVHVAVKRRRRLRRFEEHFPEALDLLNRAIRAGHAFTTGLGMIANEVSEPIAGEFRTTFEEQNFGLPLRDALQNLIERVPLIDVRFFVTALLIQKETGGNLAELLENLARVIRDRFRIYRDVRTKSAHGRLTAGILVALPLLMAFCLGIVNPSYLPVLYHDRIGPLILWGAAIWQLIGSALLWRIIHIEI